MRGLAELLENLKALDRNVKAECRGASVAGAQVVKRTAIEIARGHGLVSTGALVNNIAVKRERSTSANLFETHIGVRHGKEAKGAQKVAVRGSNGNVTFEYTDNPFYWWFWEFGHFNHFTQRHEAARPFIRPALQSKTSEVMEAMRARLAARIEKFKAGLPK